MKKMMKVLAVILALCVLTAVLPLSASAYSSDITGTVNYNPESVYNNYGFVWQNRGSVQYNREGATIHNNYTGANVNANYGRIGSDTVFSRTYGEAGNFGTVRYNYGTVDMNGDNSYIYENHGTVSGSNFGFIIDNYEEAYIEANRGLIRTNYGEIAYNTIGSYLDMNIGKISGKNTGTIKMNSGTIQNNGVDHFFMIDQTGVVEYNGGTIVLNDIYSRVDDNFGTITSNKGYVRNTSGVVTDNLEGGRVYNYGGTVTNNSGEHYVQVDLSTENATVEYGEGFSSDNGIDCWLPVGEYGTARIIPDEGYHIKSVPTGNGITSAAANGDGSWTVTVGGFDSNVGSDTWGIVMSTVCTITIDCGEYAEDIVVEAKKGDRFSDVFFESGVYDTLDALETDEFICRGDITSKPLSEIADEEEFYENTNEIWLGTVESDVKLYACFLKKIHSVELTLEAPAAGDVVTVDENGVQTPAPVITFAPDSHCYIGEDMDLNWIVDPEDFTPFEGAFVSGERYYTYFIIQSEVGYYLTENTEVKANGATVEDAFGPYAIAVTLSAKATAPAVLGDANGDGDVDSVDATIIQRVCTMLKVPYTEEQLMCGDVDGDDNLTTVDATFIQRYATMLKTPYPIGELKPA